MATINEIIQSAVDRVKLKGSETWIKWSFWTRAKDVELNSGKNVETAVSELDENISNEIDRATDRENEIETALNSEITRAKSAESTLSTSINNEITRAKNAESTLETNKVPITRTINGKALSSDITLSASDVGADASGSANTALTNAKAYTDTKVADLVGAAPETLDTLEELADALKDNADIVDVLNEAITSKASAVDLTSHTSNNTAHITADERTAWNDANNKKHEHNNKTILDNTTASYTTEEKEKLSGIKDGAESTATTTSGSNPTVTNSADAQLIYGKIAGYTVQDGVPTPDNPIDIQGLGDSGSVEVKTCGKNLLNYSEWAKVEMPYGTSVFENNGVTITATRDDTYTNYQSDQFPEEARVYVEEGKSYTLSWEESTNQSGLVFIFPNGLENNMRSVNNSTKKSLTYTANNDVSFITFRFGVEISGTTISYKNIQIEENVVATDFEPYTETTAIIPLDLPLYDGDYIEVYADGSGKLVRVNKEIVLDGSDDEYYNLEGINSYGIANFSLWANAELRYSTIKSDRLTGQSSLITDTTSEGIFNNQTRIYIRIKSERASTVDKLRTWLAENTVKAVYELATPVVTELTAEQVTQFKKLYTFDNVTNFFCDGEITARYYVNTDSGDTVGMLHKSISELQEVGSESSLGLTKLYTETGTNTDGSMTQNAITTALNGKAASSHTHNYLPLSGGTLTGNLTMADTKNIMLRTHETYSSGICYDTKGNECISLWAKNAVTRLRWNAGVDMSTMVSGKMMDITPDFEISKASGSAMGYIAGTRIVTNSGTWGISVTGNSATATKLATARTISLTGSVTGSGSFDGSGNLSIATTTNHTHNYLPLSGGTLTIGDYYGLTVKRSDTNGSAIAYSNSNGALGGVGFLSTGSFQISSGSNTNGNIMLANTTSATFPGTVTATTFYGALSGNASTATTLTTSAGSATQPVYFSGGKPVACTYTLGKSVPSNAVFTDTTYSIGNTTTAGIGKLYTGTGTATDGSMTQSAITTAINNAKSAAAQTVDINEINESTLMTYYVPFTAIGKAYELKANDGIRYIHQQGSGSSTNGAQIGSAILQLGNSSYSNTSGNKQGILRLYSHLGAYVDLKTEPVSPSASYTLKLPGASGTLATEDKVDTKLSSYLPLAGGTVDYLNISNTAKAKSLLLYLNDGATTVTGMYHSATNEVIYSSSGFNKAYSSHILKIGSSSGSMYGSGTHFDLDTQIRGRYIALEATKAISSSVSIVTSSDEKVKSFTDDIETDEEKLVELFDIIKPKSYNYKYSKADSLSIGFSAQEIEQAMIDLDIDPEKYGILNIQYGHMLSRGDDEEDGKYYTKFYEISYNDLFNLSLLKMHVMEKEHVARLESIEKRLTALENK